MIHYELEDGNSHLQPTVTQNSAKSQHSFSNIYHNNRSDSTSHHNYLRGSGDWTRFNNKNNPCPVCGETKDCRASNRTGLVHCRGDKPINLSQWESLGHDQHGFEMMKPLTTQPTIPQRKESYSKKKNV